jgi:tRNA(adenine34) deaminase
MSKALTQAIKALKINEVPVGCVIIQDDKIISRGYNQRETKKNPLAHAEIIAINKAAKKLKTWRLEKTKLYVTKEPCPMCAGAIVQARIPEIIYGCDDAKAGAAVTVLNILNNPKLNHRVKITKGILEEENKKLLQEFFKNLRTRRPKNLKT